MRLAKHFRFVLIGLSAILLSGCADVLVIVRDILKKPQDVEGICLLSMPMTIYSDDPELPDFSRRDLQRVTHELISVVEGELGVCTPGEECPYKDRLLSRNSAEVTRPVDACGPAETEGIIPQGYNYKDCLFEWGQKILAEKENFCSRTDGDRFVPYEPLAAGIWIEAYRGEQVRVRALLVSVLEKTVQELETDKTVPGSLSGRGRRQTLNGAAREAGYQIKELLEEVFRKRGF